jgi:cysteine desulfurase
MAKIAPIFADYNATTPLCPPVAERLLAWASYTGNASSAHAFGQDMDHRYHTALDTITQWLHCSNYTILSCGSATEANNWWFHSICQTAVDCPRVIVSAIEHPSVMAVVRYYARMGRIDYRICNVTALGIIDCDHLASLLTPNTLCVSVMFANNELGTIQPMARVIELAHRVGALVHCDAVQAVGKYPIHMNDLGVDALTCSAHKCYAPVGCGLLIVATTDRLTPLLWGGSQQQQLRGGTINVMGVDLFAHGLNYCYSQLPTAIAIHDWADHLVDTVNRIHRTVLAPKQHLLWNTVSMIVEGCSSYDTMMALDLQGIAVGTGSACATGATEISPVIRALSLNPSHEDSVIRLSFGYDTTPEQLAYIEQVLVTRYAA